MIRRPRCGWLAAFALALALIGCSQAAQADLADVISGTAEPGDYLHVTVTDVRTGDELLVELSDGDETLWVSGFTTRPTRGREVWTSITGGGAADDKLGLIYPSSGALDPPVRGLTETGTLGILVGVVAVVGLLAPVGVGLATAPKRAGRCSSCRTGIEHDWLTCPSCGTATGRQAEQAVPPAALQGTVVTSRPTGDDITAQVPAEGAEPSAPPAAPPSEPSAQPPAPDPRSAGTRIIRRGD